MTEEINLVAEKVKEVFTFLSKKLDAPVKYLWNVTLLSIRIEAAVNMFVSFSFTFLLFFVAYNLNEYSSYLFEGKVHSMFYGLIGAIAFYGIIFLSISLCSLGQNIAAIFTPEYIFLKKFLNYRRGIRFE